MGHIYSILNIKNNKAYVGQTIQPLETRLRKHFEKLKNNNHPNNHLQNSYNKYGEESFQWFELFECEDNLLDYYEKLYIKLFNLTNDNNGYNICKGGKGVISEEAQLRNKLTNQSKWDNVLQITTEKQVIAKYAGLNDAARKTGFELANIHKSCKDKGRIVKGYYFIYEKDWSKKWKPYINSKCQPCCIINQDNIILVIDKSKKSFASIIGKDISKINTLIKTQESFNYQKQNCKIIQLTHKEYYRYDVGTCIDYPR